jgi:hypothetical protein
MVRVQQESTRQNHRFSRNRPAFPAQWFYGLYRALPGEPGFLATVTCKTRQRLRKLSASVGAPGPHDFAVRRIVSRLAQMRLPLQRPSHPALHVRDDAYAPLASAGRAKEATDLGAKESELFFAPRLDGPNQLESVRKI